MKTTSVLPTTARRLLTAVGATAVLCAGCGRSPEPQFTFSEKTRQLLPQVRDGMTAKDEDGVETHLAGVTTAVRDRFGSLADPSVWPVLPVEFGGTPAKVTEVAIQSDGDADKPLDRVFVTLAPMEGESLDPIPAGSQVAWTGGTYEGQSHRVASSSKASIFELAGTFDDGLPEQGDELLVNAGVGLRHGRELYNRHCLHCHGPDGAGNGPTAKFLNPRPRDYRLGLYKWTSTGAAEKASREDLLGVLEQGVPGTSMPAFRLLPKDDLQALVEYVRWLSMRGEYENQLTALAFQDYSEKAVEERVADGETRDEILEELKEFLEIDFGEMTDVFGEDLADAWSTANEEDSLVVPGAPRVADTPESRARGRELYLSETTKCATCHGTYGRGDGPQSEAFNLIPGTSEHYPAPGLYDSWDNPIAPRDLTQGVFRGGRRPIDVYRRIRAGIKGTPMPGFATLTDEQVWDIVNYVLYLPHEPLPAPGEGKSLVSARH